MRRPTLQSHNASNPSLDLYATRILNQMRTNGDIFVDPMPPLADLDSVLVEFRHAVADAAHRDQRAILLRGQKRKELLRIIRLLSFYVAQIADGDENIILLSGFEPSRIPSSSGATPKPKNLRARPKIGSYGIDLLVDPWRSARMSQFEYRKKGIEAEWSIKLSSNSRCKITDLERFQEYEFRVSYIGKSGILLYSNTVSSHVY